MSGKKKEQHEAVGVDSEIQDLFAPDEEFTPPFLLPEKRKNAALRGPYRSAVPLALSNGQTPPSLSIVGLSVDIAHYVRLIGFA